MKQFKLYYYQYNLQVQATVISSKAMGEWTKKVQPDFLKITADIDTVASPNTNVVLYVCSLLNSSNNASKSWR